MNEYAKKFFKSFRDEIEWMQEDFNKIDCLITYHRVRLHAAIDYVSDMNIITCNTWRRLYRMIDRVVERLGEEVKR